MPAPDAIVSSIEGAARHGHRGVQLDLWMAVASGIEGVVRAPVQVHVLLRHRLLRAAGGFEGGVYVRVADLDSNDPPVTHRPDPGDAFGRPPRRCLSPCRASG